MREQARGSAAVKATRPAISNHWQLLGIKQQLLVIKRSEERGQPRSRRTSFRHVERVAPVEHVWCYYQVGLPDSGIVLFGPRKITLSRKTATVADRARPGSNPGGLRMDLASWQSELHARQRVDRRINRIALILFIVAAVGLLVCATFALVGLDCPIASHAA
jgi:hypothetical protein